MKKLHFLSIILPMFLITFAFSTGAVCADIDATLSDTFVSDPSGTAINPDDNVAGIAGILDDFNRANGPIGGNWTNQAGTFNVYNNAARGGFFALATYGGVTSTVLEADVECVGTALQYTGLVLGYADISNNLFMKVQQQSPYEGQFTHAAFYVGNGGYGFGPGFFTLDYPFTTAHMKVELVGSTVTMTFSKIDGGSGVQTYTGTGAPSTGGNGIGICGYNTVARLDNFATPGGEECDYCLTDSYGFDWCLNVFATDGQAYYMDGTTDANAGYEAIATYVYSNQVLSMSAINPTTPVSNWEFTFNTKFISSTRATGVVVDAHGFIGSVTVDLVECGAAAEVEAEVSGAVPGVK